LEANGKYKEALTAYKTYFDAIDKEKAKIYYQKTTVAQELHELKVNHLYSLQKKDTQIWLGLCLVLILIIVIGIIYYQLRLGKKNRIISEQEKS
jgi:type VI protein secretion system component VasF